MNKNQYLSTVHIFFSEQLNTCSSLPFLSGFFDQYWAKIATNQVAALATSMPPETVPQK